MMAAPRATPLVRLATLLNDIGALKRIRRAGAPYSVGAALFLRAWRRAAALENIDAIACEMTALAIVASRLGAIDGAILARSGLEAEARLAIFRAAFDSAASPLAPEARSTLRAAIPHDADFALTSGGPPFARALAEQPRAGATALDAPRLVLEPPETHAEHCFAVCAYAMLVAPHYETAGSDAVLLGLAHHLHNATLPDSGFAGEVLLGERLGAIVERFTEDALAQIPGTLATRVRDVRARLLPAADQPEARAFHAADVIDRVLQVRQYARVAAFDVSHAVDELGLVHAGPIEHFHAEVLAETGLL